MNKKGARALTSANLLNFCPKSKRSVSPVVATVLLIGIVIAIAIIIFLWMRGLTKEAVTKDLGFGDENIELACDDVVFRADYYNDNLEITNDGNIPIEDFKIKSKGSTEYLSDLSDETTRVRQGRTKSFEVDGLEGEIILIPVLRGDSESGEQDYTCSEMYGVKVS